MIDINNNLNAFLESKYKLKGCNLVWRYYSTSEYIGNCSYLIRALQPLKGADYNCLLERYTDSAKNIQNGTIDSSHCGRTYDYIISLAKKYQEACLSYDVFDSVINNSRRDKKYLPVKEAEFNKTIYSRAKNLSLETFIQDIYTHIIIETLDGYNAEKEIIKKIESDKEHDYSCKHSNEYDDTKNGIDIFVNEKDKCILAIQCKPLPFFMSSNKGTVRDNEKAVLQAKKCQENFGVPLYFVVYYMTKRTKDNEPVYALLHKINGKYLFNISDFYSYAV